MKIHVVWKPHQNQCLSHFMSKHMQKRICFEIWRLNDHKPCNALQLVYFFSTLTSFIISVTIVATTQLEPSRKQAHATNLCTRASAASERSGMSASRVALHLLVRRLSHPAVPSSPLYLRVGYCQYTFSLQPTLTSSLSGAKLILETTRGYCQRLVFYRFIA